MNKIDVRCIPASPRKKWYIRHPDTVPSLYAISYAMEILDKTSTIS